MPRLPPDIRSRPAAPAARTSQDEDVQGSDFSRGGFDDDEELNSESSPIVRLLSFKFYSLTN
jgi:hypothetical protein